MPLGCNQSPQGICRQQNFITESQCLRIGDDLVRRQASCVFALVAHCLNCRCPKQLAWSSLSTKGPSGGLSVDEARGTVLEDLTQSLPRRLQHQLSSKGHRELDLGTTAWPVLETHRLHSLMSIMGQVAHTFATMGQVAHSFFCYGHSGSITKVLL